MTDTPRQPELSDEQIEFLNKVLDMARQGKVQMLSSVIDQGIPANLTDGKGDSLLILAAYNSQPEVVKALIERGAELDQLNARGQSALTCAVFKQDEESTRMLLEAGADPKLGPQNALAVTEMFDLPRFRAIIEEYL
ncbi:ankyrin repeat domain-containing protein [Glutamicibacter sp. V16R2B1]|uniref:ankyrin repeat domain-containing protein n=1 Tax=Glutamicibacter TaxID=1742989 RepID=UPI0010FE7F0A|nr:ankyrin repeat domain-containing protein [Glutamicibacter sp. V16R2B1]TLK55335.1 ankyrin repeat domain-containing protein [Glutamicibacter sp. V16R2B1]